ncbi:MAG TPA: DNA (cytosine-5-)-methyltransferase [Candidatus Scalindua sp.]|nr:DNA (cytosine-5-)-methyltransferase [Candidatus Scalindua sp.]
MKYLSLFSGIGGFELGIQQAYEEQEPTFGEGARLSWLDRHARTNKEKAEVETIKSDIERRSSQKFTCIGYSEIDKYAIQIYEKHFKHKNFGDITKIDPQGLPDFGLLCGGFPCQSFSIAGKRGGFEDTRGTLFFDIARIAKAKRPRLLFLENVKGLLSHDDGRTFNTIIATLDELGYDLQWQVLNSKNFGVPQNRERVFIIGHLRGTPRPKVFPFGTSDKINDKIQQEQGREGSRASCLNTRYGQRWTDESYIQQTSSTINSGGGGQGAKTGLYQLGTKIRRLTPTECERLQGFPDGWTKGVSDTQRYKCLGNAVSCPVVKAIAERLLL